MGVHDLVLRCPHCGVRNDAHQNADAADRHRPRDGSLSVCATCHGVAVFETVDVGMGDAATGGRGVSGRAGGLRLRKPTVQEAADLLRDDDFRELMREARRLNVADLRRRVPYVWS